jgi:hypothetical protein
MDEAMAGVAFFGIFIVWIIAHYCYLSVKAWHETALKRDMVSRGYSANEIIDVISGARGDDTLGSVPPAKPIRQPA